MPCASHHVSEDDLMLAGWRPLPTRAELALLDESRPITPEQRREADEWFAAGWRECEQQERARARQAAADVTPLRPLETARPRAPRRTASAAAQPRSAGDVDPDGQRRHAFGRDLGRLLADLYLEGKLDGIMDENNTIDA